MQIGAHLPLLTPRMTFSTKILIGLAAGIVTGLFLGERAAALDVVADGFVKLLQMTVLPYVTVSIVSSLGRARPTTRPARSACASGAVLAGLWLVALVFAFLMPLAFPTVENASFFSTTLRASGAPPFDFVDLYIPVQPVQLAGQQRRAGGGAVLGAASAWR